MKPTSSSQRGLTLIEAGAVLAITAIVASQAAPSLRSLIDHRRLDGVGAALAADLQAARFEAIARNRPVRLSIDAAQACWVLHTGAAGDCRCSAAGPAACTAPGAEVLRSQVLAAGDGLGLAANVAAIAFDPVLGTSTPSGTLRVTHQRGGEIRHTVNVLGRTRSCIAGATIASWRAC
jgi:type IV fimbrial biogenesis protein FimT